MVYNIQINCLRHLQLREVVKLFYFSCRIVVRSVENRLLYRLVKIIYLASIIIDIMFIEGKFGGNE